MITIGSQYCFENLFSLLVLSDTTLKASFVASQVLLPGTNYRVIATINLDTLLFESLILLFQQNIL